MSPYPSRVSFCVVYVRIVFSKERVEEEQRRLAEEEAWLLRTTAYSRCVIVGWRPLVWAEAGRCNAPNKGWQSACNRLEEYLKICNRRKYHIVKEKDGFALFGGEVFKSSRACACAMMSAAMCCMLQGCARRSKKICRRGVDAGIQSPTLGNWGVCADSCMASCRHMLATKNTVENDPGIRCKVSFLFELKDCAYTNTICHRRFAEHAFWRGCFSTLGMHSGGTAGRRKEKTGGGGWARVHQGSGCGG